MINTNFLALLGLTKGLDVMQCNVIINYSNLLYIINHVLHQLMKSKNPKCISLPLNWILLVIQNLELPGKAKMRTTAYKYTKENL